METSLRLKLSTKELLKECKIIPRETDDAVILRLVESYKKHTKVQ